LADLIDSVRQGVERHGLFSAGESIVVGVSGGPDSLCLLHLLCRLKGEYRLTIHVAHLHHGLRGADADGDAAFVERLAADWALTCTLEQADVPALARKYRLAVEEAARRARYAFLRRVAEEIGARTIAVGHNADDQAETVLMHWLRGSGMAGLRGMLARTFLNDYRLLEVRQSRQTVSDLYLIRPLLEVTRAEIEAYCEYHGLEPRFDRSNLDTTYYRNWLRHEVFPMLARHNPNVQEVFRRSARVIADDYALLRALLEENWPSVVVEETGERISFDLDGWRALPVSLQRSTVREAIHRLRYSLRSINFLHVENAVCVARDGATGDQATIPRGLVLTVKYERLTVADADAVEPLPNWPLLPPKGEPVQVRIPGQTVLPESSWRLVARVMARGDLPAGWEANPDPWRAFLDAGALGSSPWLRTRHAGDRFCPLGMGGRSVKVADFLTNQKVPRHVRDRLPLLVGKQGVFWLCGQRVDENVRIRASTETVLELHFLRETEA
jgi:tRNA(Ile)-lysidine synthase